MRASARRAAAGARARVRTRRRRRALRRRRAARRRARRGNKKSDSGEGMVIVCECHPYVARLKKTRLGVIMIFSCYPYARFKNTQRLGVKGLPFDACHAQHLVRNVMMQGRRRRDSDGSRARHWRCRRRLRRGHSPAERHATPGRCRRSRRRGAPRRNRSERVGPSRVSAADVAAPWHCNVARC